MKWYAWLIFYDWKLIFYLQAQTAVPTPNGSSTVTSFYLAVVVGIINRYKYISDEFLQAILPHLFVGLKAVGNRNYQVPVFLDLILSIISFSSPSRLPHTWLSRNCPLEQASLPNYKRRSSIRLPNMPEREPITMPCCASYISSKLRIWRKCPPKLINTWLHSRTCILCFRRWPPKQSSLSYSSFAVLLLDLSQRFDASNFLSALLDTLLEKRYHIIFKNTSNII